MSKVNATGTVKRVIFRNDTGFSIMSVDIDKNIVTVAGESSARPGDEVSIDGSWVSHPKFGKQIKATSIVATLPETVNGMAKYLSSGILPGIGEKLAQRIVDKFGDKTFEIMDGDIGQLESVSGISEKKLATIREHWQRANGTRKIMVFLQGHDLTAALARRIYVAYVENGVGKRLDGTPDADMIIAHIRNKPWDLARNVRGVGFLTADRIALSLGKREDDPARLMAALACCLEENSGMGNCGMATAELISRTSDMLVVDKGLVERAHRAELVQQKPAFIEEGAVTWIASLHRMENEIAEMLLERARGKPAWGEIDVQRAIGWVEAEIGEELVEQQRVALGMAISHPISVVTGGPGCGKTFLLNAIIKVLGKKNVDIMLAAPTGRAACRMEEATGREASTIHRALALGELQCQLLSLDEVSMVDIPLLHKTLKTLPKDAAILMVGDPDQLPSVGPGAVLNDIINSGAIPVTRLNEVRRQAKGSAIIAAAHRINRGMMPDLTEDPASDFIFIEEDDHEKLPQVIGHLVSTRLPQEYGLHPVDDIQVLSPMKKSGSGTQSLNDLIQSLVNPKPSDQHVSFGVRYGVGDKVMQTSNDYERCVFNGDSGIIRRIDKDDGVMTVEFGGEQVNYWLNELDDLALAAAITIHKSQGSQYPAVIMPVSTQHYIMLQRNLMYTGLTRAAKLCVMVGSKKALATAIRNTGASKRLTRLGGLLRAGLSYDVDSTLRELEQRSGAKMTPG